MGVGRTWLNSEPTLGGSRQLRGSCRSLAVKLLLLSLLATTVLSAPSDPKLHKLTTEELEMMSKELQKEELSKMVNLLIWNHFICMVNDAEKFKLVLASPRSSATEKVEAARRLKEFYDTTRLELYAANFKESLRRVLLAVDERASGACGVMGVHRFSIDDHWLKENCKRAVKMVWGLLLTDYTRKSEAPFGDLKSKARQYLLSRLQYNQNNAN